MKLFFRKYGEGQPLIILHGIFGISDNWVTIGRRLAEQFEVFIPDQRNHGQSPHSDAFNYMTLSDDIIEFMEDHQIYNAVIIGHSMGGKVSMKLTLEYPQRFDKLVVIDISPRRYKSRQEHMDIIDAMLSVNFDEVKTRKDIENIIKDKIRSDKVRNFIMKNIYRIGKTRLAWRLNVKGIYHNLDAVTEQIDLPFQFNKPSLFIRGGNSSYIADDDIELIRSYFPQAQMASVEGASHWLHADKPDELCFELSKFLRKDCAYDPQSGN